MTGGSEELDSPSGRPKQAQVSPLLPASARHQAFPSTVCRSWAPRSPGPAPCLHSTTQQSEGLLAGLFRTPPEKDFAFPAIIHSSAL